MESLSPASQRFIELRQGFHHYAEENRKTDPVFTDKEQIVVDIDVSGIKNPAHFSGLDEIKYEYGTFLADIPSGDENHEMLVEKANADLMLAREISGEELPFNEYVQTATGVMPKQAPASEIAALQDRLEDLLAIQGMHFDSADKTTYEQKFAITDPDEMKREFYAAIELSRLAVGQLVVPPSERPSLQFVNDVKIPWSGYMEQLKNGQFNIRANIHPSRKFNPGRIKLWMLHEDGGHVVQFGIWKELVKRGKLNSAAGLVAMHSPEVTHFETVTAIAESLLPGTATNENEKWLADFETTHLRLAEAVYHNAYQMINTGTPEDDCVKYAEELLPFDDTDRIRSLLTASRDQPTFKAVLGCYYPARQFASSLIANAEPKYLWRDVDRLYTSALTIEGLKKAVGLLS